MDIPPAPVPSVPPKTIVWGGFAIMVLASVVTFGAMAGKVPGDMAAAAFFSLAGHFAMAAGLLRFGLAEDTNPTVRAGALVAAALLLVSSLKG